MNVNGTQVPLVGLNATKLAKILRLQMEQDGRKGLGIRFVNSAEVSALAQILKVEREGVFPTLASRIAEKLDFGYDELELTLNIWPNRRH